MYWYDGSELEGAQDLELFSGTEIKSENEFPQVMDRPLSESGFDDMEQLTMEEFLQDLDLGSCPPTEIQREFLQLTDMTGGDSSDTSEVSFTDDQLLDMSAKDVNRLKGLTKQELKTIKKRRRVLLNRRYARKSREKRIDAQTNANLEKKSLLQEMSEVKMELKTTQGERDMYKAKYLELRGILTNCLSKCGKGEML